MSARVDSKLHAPTFLPSASRMQHSIRCLCKSNPMNLVIERAPSFVPKNRNALSTNGPIRHLSLRAHKGSTGFAANGGPHKKTGSCRPKNIDGQPQKMNGHCSSQTN